MTPIGLFQSALILGILFLCAKPLGSYIARLFQGERTWLHPILQPLEKLFYRLAGIQPDAEMNWKSYAVAMLLFNGVGLLFVYLLQRFQAILPLNPQQFGAVSPDSAFNTAASFATNTNWQAYSGETTMSYFTQMTALTVQNFLSAATGMAVLIAFIRGIVRATTQTVGNFWTDMTRSTLYVLLPLSFLLAIVLVSQGVVQNFQAYQTSSLLQSTPELTTQTLPMGPAASQIAIKQLGSNGGGFFNTNSAHPFENPTFFSNTLELIAILLIPVALCFTFGEMVGDQRQGWALLIVMTLIFVATLLVTLASEQSGNPTWEALGVDQTATAWQSGGNMEGKETRFGITSSALWAVVTTASSNGAVNSMHDSYTPLGGAMPMWLMQLGEVIYGGVGSGLYGMLAFVIVAVFIAGLMVGRTPEYLGKKIEVYEMKMASLMILIPVLVILIGTALAVVTPAGISAIYNPGVHGFSEVLYAFSSASNNNGSAFAGLGANTPFYNTVLALAMLIPRYWLAVPALALAGSLAAKKRVPKSAGTLPTHTPLFIGWLIGVVIVVGALSFVPALALGPIVEQLILSSLR